MHLIELQQWVKLRINSLFRNTLTHLDIASSPLKEALLYSTLDGGKRLRPLLVYAVGALKNVPLPRLDSAALTLEMIHCYSLVHDDLPAMDNAFLRRGQPSCHAAFGEALGVLTGDALLTLAFEILATDTHLSDTQKVLMLQTLSKAAGPEGMVDGQAIDMDSEGKALTLPQLTQLHAKKTGALIEAAVKLGYLAWDNIHPDEQTALQCYSAKIGLAFQVKDDILDATASSITLGKPSGNDAALQKNTFVHLLGLEGATTFCIQLIEEAKAACALLPQSHTLLELADYIHQRTA